MCLKIDKKTNIKLFFLFLFLIFNYLIIILKKISKNKVCSLSITNLIKLNLSLSSLIINN